MAFDETRYKAEFNKDNYDDIIIRVPKGKKAEIKALASSHGKSVNALIIECIEQQTGLTIINK
ncbi:Arc family DNA-binding protein [Butyricicoccus faecihominis]|uniref:Arc family DNA-binding protein n=1 Tax=Butyricicoccus faecihominis TaxID=1712515 RepID=UPI00247AF295|nr:Arc family DNA-binding protein [Butyricicoccus faecihominis]MCQ5129305.1 Arc family DNA-binding protein [Butyricicoccus faecihominis]